MKSRTKKRAVVVAAALLLALRPGRRDVTVRVF
jgi:hypothetical protein